MSVLSEVPAAGLKELARYLNGFPSKDDDAEQFWYLLAGVLRKKNRSKFDYTEQFLVAVGQREDRAALVFLKDLIRRGITPEELEDGLEVIKCQKALNFFFQGATTPVISEPAEEEHRKLKAGDTLCLNVKATCNPGRLEYVWFHDRQPLVHANTSQLTISDITTGHRGMYHCKVTNPHINNPKTASTVSPATRVEVWAEEHARSNGIHRQETTHQSPPPVIIQHPSDVGVRIGQKQPAYLICTAEQGLYYDWYKDGKEYVRDRPTGRLELYPVTAAHLGEYCCEVVNDGGKERSNKARVILSSDITITPCSELAQTHCVGEKLELSCTATSTSGNQLHYEWFRMGRDGPEECVAVGMVLSATISSRNLRSDGKLKFKCKVTDEKDAGNFTFSEEFVVKVLTVWIVEHPHDVVAQLKQRTQLTCAAKGQGKLSYTWLKASTQNGRFEFHKCTELGVLPFDRLSNQDAGYYQCLVSNGRSFAESKAAQIKPRLPNAMNTGSSSPVFKVLREPWSCAVLQGKPFRLTFDVVCSPNDPLKYQWFFQGEKINGATSCIYEREKTGVEDCGQYSCEVRTGSVCVVSKPAKVDLQNEETIPPNIRWDQGEGELFFRTTSQQRFVREKIALLIGNQCYDDKNLGHLNTPENDIKAVQNVLRQPEFDFKVFSFLDLTHAEMQAVLEMFYSLLEVSGTYALFYFSGHGFSISRGNNFLVPVDSPPDPDSCFQVDSIIKRMQEKFSRAILFLDACKVVKELVSCIQETAFDSIQDLANVFEEWSCVDRTSAYDSLDRHGTSFFNSAFIKAIQLKQPLNAVHDSILKDMIRSSEQRPQHTGSMADNQITLQDPIMIDRMDLQEPLHQILLKYQAVHRVPGSVTLRGKQMKELNSFAELKLSFSLVLTNVLSVQAALHQVHGDKTSSASVEFSKDFLSTRGVMCSQSMDALDGQDEGLCAKTSMLVKGLQKLESPLNLLMKVCLWESMQERCASINYTLELTSIATIASS